MALSEFDLIQRYFVAVGPDRTDVLLGVGDDCALLQPPPGQHLVVSMDTLVEGVHFRPGADPESLGHKALAVNLSDLAAMGATPAWVTLGLTLPAVDEAWLAAFSHGLARLAARHGVQLIGGDTTRGPLNLTLQIHGLLPAGQALRRDAARPGDLIGVTGTLGDAGLALRGGVGSAEDDAYLQRRLDCPEPRIEAGRALLGLAHAAIDVSDGLLADLGHICERSRVGATLDLDRLPLSPPVSRHLQKSADWALPLASGDDYELCVTVPAERREEAQAQVARSGDRLTWIGVVEAESGIRCRQANGDLLQFAAGGYTHFQSP